MLGALHQFSGGVEGKALKAPTVVGGITHNNSPQ
jgi:hypothetical protein